jgi:hypothetical protein
MYIVWTHRWGPHAGIYFSKSSDGENWSLPSVKVSGDLYYNYSKPCVKIRGEVISVTYDASDSLDGWLHVFYTESVDGGDSWMNPSLRVDDPSIVYAQYPSICLGSTGDIGILYAGKKQNPGYRPMYFSGGFHEKFIRGDVDSDMDVLMSDVVFTLRYLYLPGSASPDCMKSCDSDDSGNVAMSDALYTLRYLYLPESPNPPYPFPECGPDPSMDELECYDHPCMSDARNK